MSLPLIEACYHTPSFLLLSHSRFFTLTSRMSIKKRDYKLIPQYTLDTLCNLFLLYSSSRNMKAAIITPAKMSIAVFLILGCFVTLNSASHSQIQSSMCSVLQYGKIPFPGDCTRFVRCFFIPYFARTEACPTGLAFNPQTSACDAPKNVPGCDDNNSGPLEA